MLKVPEQGGGGAGPPCHNSNSGLPTDIEQDLDAAVSWLEKAAAHPAPSRHADPEGDFDRIVRAKLQLGSVYHELLPEPPLSTKKGDWLSFQLALFSLSTVPSISDGFLSEDSPY